MTENEVAKEIVDAAYKIHTTLGPGLLESVYQAVLEYELLDTPRDKSTGILGSTKPLNLESLRHLDQRWDSPQALIGVCPTLFAFEASPV